MLKFVGNENDGLKKNPNVMNKLRKQWMEASFLDISTIISAQRRHAPCLQTRDLLMAFLTAYLLFDNERIICWQYHAKAACCFSLPPIKDLK